MDIGAVCNCAKTATSWSPPKREDYAVQVLLLVGAFVALWTGATLMLSCFPFFQRRATRDLADRLRPFVDGGDDVDSLQRWLDRHWETQK